MKMLLVSKVLAIAFGQHIIKLPLAKVPGKKPEGPFVTKDLKASWESFGENGETFKKWAKAYFEKTGEAQIEEPEWAAAFATYTKVMESGKCTDAEFGIVNKIAGIILSCERELNQDFDQGVDETKWDAQIDHLELMCQLIAEAEKQVEEQAAAAAAASKAAPKVAAPTIPSIATGSEAALPATVNTETAIAALGSAKVNMKDAFRTLGSLMNQMANLAEAVDVAEEAISNTETPAA